MIWVDLIYNLALLVALSVISTFVDARCKRNTRVGMLLQGVVFGGAAVIGMLRPFVFAPGLIFDGRSVMISLGGLFFGPWTALVTCLMTIPVRVIQGGPGTVMGVLVILVSAVIGAGFHFRLHKKKEISVDSLFVFGLVVHLAMLAMTVALPQDMIFPVLKRIAWPVMLIYPLATVLIGKILSDQTIRNQLLQILREREENLRITLNSIGDAVISTDINGKVTGLNPVAEALTGWSQKEAVGQSLETVFRIINEQPRQTCENPASKVLAEGAIVALANHTLLLAKDGREIPIADSGAPIKNETGEITGVVLVFRDQTEERAAQKSLYESEERYRQLFSRASIGIILLSSDGRILSANETYARTLGYSPEEMLHIKPEDLDTPESAQLFPARLQRIMAGEILTFEVENYHRNGRVIPFEVCASRIDIGGKSYFQSFVRDISERKQMEKVLEQKIVALTRPLDRSDDITFEDLFDVDEFQRIQDEFSNATGVTSAIFRPDGTEITEVSNTSNFCRHIIRKTEKGCVNCFKSDEALAQSFDPKTPVVQRCLSAGLWDGCVGIMVGDHHIANWTIGQVRDETQTEEQALQYAREIGADEEAFLKAYRELPCMSGERFKQIAQALFTLANQLSTSAYQNIQQARFIAEQRKTEEKLLRLSAAINQAKEIVVITNTAGVIEYVNPAFGSITGYSSEEVIGKPISILKSGRLDDAFYRNLWQTISSGQAWTGQFINKRKDGTLYTEEAVISPVRNLNGDIVNYVAVKRDVTEELSKEEEYRHAQKMEAIGQLAGGIAHDFNNILQAILGFSEILMGRLKEETAEHRNVAEIKKAATRAADLTRQLLAFSRKQSTEKTQVDINTVIRDTEVLLQLLLGENISYIFDLAQNLSLINADSGQMTQILMNLAINARDAMPEGGRLTISTENIRLSPPDVSAIPGSEPGEFVCLAMTDTGCGISQGVKAHLFEPFFTTKEPGKGTGLGLSVIYGIIKKHKGWINVYSEEGMGTTFKIYLPVTNPTTLPADETFLPQETGYEQILLVEDDPPARNLVIRLLQNAGYRVSATGSAEEALAQFNQEPAGFTLLFSDIVLPGETGIELADRIRKINPALPVLLYSGYRDQRERWSNLDIKGYHFLQKPFTTTTLLAAVYDALEKSKR